MATLNMTTFDAALKVRYTDQKIQDMVYADAVALAMVPKKESGGGKYEVIPLKYGNVVGSSATFATAQGNKGSSLLTDFAVTRIKHYTLADIDNEVVLASKGMANAFMEAAEYEIDSAIATEGRDLAISLYGDGSGALAQVDSVNSQVITLKNPSDVVNFEVGRVLVAYTAKSGGSQHDSTFTISKIDRILGKLTVVGTITHVVQDDWLFFEGDRGLKLAGFGAWLPDTAPTTGDNFFGVDRSVDVTRLSGLREDYSNAVLEEAIIDAANLVAREGGKPDTLFVSFEKYGDLVKSLGSKVQYLDAKVGTIGFAGVQLTGPKGIIKVLPDQNCPTNRGYLLTMKTWQLISLGKAPQILMQDGLRAARNASSDSVEVRIGHYSNLACFAPGWNMVLKF